MSEEVKEEEAKTEEVKPAEAKPEEVSDADKDEAVEQMKKASKDTLEGMREEGNEKSDEIVDEAEQKIDQMYDDFRAWLKTNTSPEKVKADVEKLKQDTASLIEKTREKVSEVANSPTFKETMKAGGDFIKGAGSMIGEGFQYGYDKLMGIPEVKKVAEKVDEGVDKLRQSKFLKDAVSGAEKGLSEFNQAVFKGLNDFFDKGEAKKEAPEEKTNSGKE